MERIARVNAYQVTHKLCILQRAKELKRREKLRKKEHDKLAKKERKAKRKKR